MRRSGAALLVAAVLVLGGAGVDAAPRRTRRAPAPRVDAPISVFECDTRRGVDAFGSTERCLRASCVGRNVTNAFVLDDARRQRRNPCVGVDPFEGGR